jgi:hypothetical protein
VRKSVTLAVNYAEGMDRYIMQNRNAAQPDNLISADATSKIARHVSTLKQLLLVSHQIA